MTDLGFEFRAASSRIVGRPLHSVRIDARGERRDPNLDGDMMVMAEAVLPHCGLLTNSRRRLIPPSPRVVGSRIWALSASLRGWTDGTNRAAISRADV